MLQVTSPMIRLMVGPKSSRKIHLQKTLSRLSQEKILGSMSIVKECVFPNEILCVFKGFWGPMNHVVKRQKHPKNIR